MLTKNPLPVIAIFDVGKTNKKLFLFDEQYRIVFERSARFLETLDEDGDVCENLESLRLSIFDSLHEIFRMPQFEVKAINFSSYGASLVYLDSYGRPLTPLYNYLKEYPEVMMKDLHLQYGGGERFSQQTASPILGSLNAGLQIYRLQQEKKDLYKDIAHILHLPQYLSFLLSGTYYSELTSIGCHTALWDFEKKEYHAWVKDHGIVEKLAPICSSDAVFSSTFPGSPYVVGTGLHDSSAALIPYLLNFQEPFILISTGTWSISFNPFNHDVLTLDELNQDCLFYLSYQGKPVKASRLFAGYEHDLQTKRIAEYFHCSAAKFRNLGLNQSIVNTLKIKISQKSAGLKTFAARDLSQFENEEEAYHQFIMDLTDAQFLSTQLLINGQSIHRIFVDGGFSKNSLYMNLLADKFPEQEVYAASMAQATALGTALAIHQHWNQQPLPNNLIELKFFASWR